MNPLSHLSPEDSERLRKSLDSQSALKWSDQIPAEPGWYWCYGKMYGGKEIVFVSVARGEMWSNGCKVQEGYLWAGPIQEPSGQLPEPEKKM